MQKFFLIVFSILFSFCYAKNFWVSAFITIQIPHKKVNTIFFNSELDYSVSENNQQLKIFFNLYNVEIKIYNNEKVISCEKYNKYSKIFYYTLNEREGIKEVLDNNEEDPNIWNFLKPILIFYEFYNFSKSNLSRFVIRTSKSEMFFIRSSKNKYTINEKFRDNIISNGYIFFNKNFIDFYLETDIPKGISDEVNFEVKSTIKARIKKLKEK